jgi:hypothetical protein
MHCQMTRGPEQHGRVAVVPAGVHFPRGLGAVLERVEFLNRQGVHVSPQPDRALAAATLKHPHNPCLAEASVDAQSPFFETLSNKIRRSNLFVSQFGMGVDASSERLDFVSRGQDFRNEFHDAFDRWM